MQVKAERVQTDSSVQGGPRPWTVNWPRPHYHVRNALVLPVLTNYFILSKFSIAIGIMSPHRIGFHGAGFIQDFAASQVVIGINRQRTYVDESLEGRLVGDRLKQVSGRNRCVQKCTRERLLRSCSHVIYDRHAFADSLAVAAGEEIAAHKMRFCIPVSKYARQRAEVTRGSDQATHVVETMEQ